jgi:hypothetical protein
MLTLDQIISRFESLSSEDKTRALAGVSYHLTIAGRDVALEGACQEQRNKLLAVSELQHKLVSQMMSLLKNSPNRYPDRDFFMVLDSMSKEAGLIRYLQAAWAKVL